jgi:hypothetical protein
MKPDQYRNVYFYHDQVAGGSGYFKRALRGRAVMVWRGMSIVAYGRTRAQLKRLASRIKADRALFGRTNYIAKRTGPKRPITQLRWQPETVYGDRPSFGDTFAKISVGRNVGKGFARVASVVAQAAVASSLFGVSMSTIAESLRERQEELKRKYGPEVFAKAVELAKVTPCSAEDICETIRTRKGLNA